VGRRDGRSARAAPLRTDVGDVGLVSLSADLAQMLVDQVVTAIGIVREETG
jgi:hypothetical protein